MLTLERAVAEPDNEFVRDSIIKRFEFTYEVAYRFIRAWVLERESIGSTITASRKDLYRSAAQLGLIDDPALWIAFHNASNMTSHLYNEEVAKEVLGIVPEFIVEVKKLLANGGELS